MSYISLTTGGPTSSWMEQENRDDILLRSLVFITHSRYLSFDGIYT